MVARSQRSGLARREARLGVALILPAVLVVGGLVLFPLLWNVALSIQPARLLNIREVGLFGFMPTLRNYRVVVSDLEFWAVFRTTFVYTVAGTILSIVGGMWAALTLRRPFRGRGLVRGLTLFPYVVPVIAAAFVWKTMLNPTFGIVNEWIDVLGGRRVDFLGTLSHDVHVFGLTLSIPLALVMVILFEGWRYFPFAFLFILAALQALPQDVEEAAIVDGATPSQRFWYITLPQLRPVLSVLFLLRFIWTFNKFDDVYLLTGGGAGTEVITVKIVDWLLGRGDVGAAAALGMILAAVLLVLMAVYFRWFYQEEVA
ncbi:MAG TPA: sugar ABC transporter permease [Actinobacteria bacterium]|nr:sugar ABC transporter permease [Actinomycetota bacterium]